MTSIDIDTHEHEWNTLRRNPAYRDAYREYAVAQAWHIKLTGSPYSGKEGPYRLSEVGCELKQDILELGVDFLNELRTEDILSRESVDEFMETGKRFSEETINCLILEGLRRRADETGTKTRTAAAPFFPCLYLGSFPHPCGPQLEWADLKRLAAKFGQEHSFGARFSRNAVVFIPYGGISGTVANVSIDLRANSKQITRALLPLLKELRKAFNIETIVRQGQTPSLTIHQEDMAIEMLKNGISATEITMAIDPNLNPVERIPFKGERLRVKDTGTYKAILELKKSLNNPS